ncbi:MAG: glycosyltransferase family 8 protein [[Pasteurella] mairii]|nr:glycosyltransferase family 8 protein [[Pasteurella] mairii]
MIHAKQTNKQTNQTINIALVADIGYSEQVITLIKSLCYHHRNIRFYLIHKDYVAEWFDYLNHLLTDLNAEIIPINITKDPLFSEKFVDAINKPAFYRYAVPNIPEERVLYLDSDIVVDDNIENMYFSDFGDNFALAVDDMCLNHLAPHAYFEFPDMKPYFNSGVLLINNKLWQQHNLKNILVDMTLEYSRMLYPDQDVLNIVLKGKWRALDKIYNYQVGIIHSGFETHDIVFAKYPQEITLNPPKIIHYTTPYKPWISHPYTVLLREKYWFYYKLSWNEIKAKHAI